MSQVKRVVLDVLKPHTPNILDIAKALAAVGQQYCVCIDVKGVDEKTETVLIDLEADDIDYNAVVEVITDLGGSVHSIDQVEVHGSGSKSSS